MAKSVFSFLSFFFIVSLLLLLAAASTTSAAGNATSGLRYGGCAPGDTVGECITAAVEEEGVEAVVRRILQQQRRKLSAAALQKGQTCNGKIAGNCIGTVNRRNAPCTYYDRCKR